MREITDGQRRARLGGQARPGCPGRDGRGGGRVGHLPARDRAAERLPLGGAPAPTPPARTSTGRSTTTASVVKQLAMRRTMFVFPRDVLPHVWGSASDRVAQMLRTRLAKEVEANGIAKRGDVWLTRMFNTVLEALAERAGDHRRAARADPAPGAAAATCRPGKSYGGNFPIAPRRAGHARRHRRDPARRQRGRLAHLAAALDAHRGVARRGGHQGAGRRRLPRARPAVAAALRPRHRGRPRLVARRDQGRRTPGAGETSTRSRSPSPTGPGFLLPDDLDDVPEPEPWAALLPVLDPTTMGWKQRDFYLDPEDRPAPVRHQRQRRHHRLVVRPGRRLLGPGPRRRRARRALAATSAPRRSRRSRTRPSG